MTTLNFIAILNKNRNGCVLFPSLDIILTDKTFIQELSCCEWICVAIIAIPLVIICIVLLPFYIIYKILKSCFRCCCGGDSDDEEDNVVNVVAEAPRKLVRLLVVQREVQVHDNVATVRQQVRVVTVAE